MIKVESVERKEGRVIRLEILFDHHLHFVFSPNKKGKPELVAWAQIPNNSRYWLERIWARAYAIFVNNSDSDSDSISVPVIEGENFQLILKF
ncbi:hypothetical protein K9K85_01450 [Patescibacteria group bacterium]|nr:hypothetical protein [Patescibacteria group bacterium]